MGTGILRADPDDVELLLPAARHVRARDGVCVHYAADLRAVRGLTARGLRIAGTSRAVADHARHAGFTPLCRAIADAERLRHCTLHRFWWFELEDDPRRFTREVITRLRTLHSVAVRDVLTTSDALRDVAIDQG